MGMSYLLFDEGIPHLRDVDSSYCKNKVLDK